MAVNGVVRKRKFLKYFKLALNENNEENYIRTVLLGILFDQLLQSNQHIT